MERSKFKHDNPLRESMNNFHAHMPGNFMRIDVEGSMGQMVFKECEHFLADEETTWPEEKKRLLKRVESVVAIQRDVDVFLSKNPQLLKNWQTVQPISEGGLSIAMREHVLRPVYVELRKEYSEEDLSK